MLWLVLAIFLFYSLNVTGFRVKHFALVDGSCIKNEPIDMVFWFLFLLSIITLILCPVVGKWALCGFILLGIVVFFFKTIRYMLFPMPNKIKSYNAYFANTHHLFAPSEKRLVHDTFHLALMVLLFVNFMLMF